MGDAASHASRDAGSVKASSLKGADVFEQFGGFFTIADDASADSVPLTAASLIEAFPARVDAVDSALPQASHLKPAERERVITSVAHQGWMARLVSPMLAARVAGIQGGFSWKPDTTSFFDLALNSDAPHTPGALYEFTRHVSDTGLSMKVLEGNTASALNNAARLMATHDDSNHEIYRSAFDLMRELELPEEPGSNFHRTSCCLIYKLTGPPRPQNLCGDCVLRVRG